MFIPLEFKMVLFKWILFKQSILSIEVISKPFLNTYYVSFKNIDLI